MSLNLPQLLPYTNDYNKGIIVDMPENFVKLFYCYEHELH